MTGSKVGISYGHGQCPGTIVSFRIGAEDAERMANELGNFVEDDFCNLPRYHIYLRLMIDGIAGDAFSETTMPPKDLSETEMNSEKIIRVSRERFATRQSIVEEKINKCIDSQNI